MVKVVGPCLLKLEELEAWDIGCAWNAAINVMGVNVEKFGEGIFVKYTRVCLVKVINN